MITVKSEFVGLSPRKASLRNNRNYSEDFFETDQANLNENLTSSTFVRIKNTNVKSEIENNKRKRRESHETSGSDKDESNRQLIVPKLTIIPSISLSPMEMKKCKFETERERMFRVSGTLVMKSEGIL